MGIKAMNVGDALLGHFGEDAQGEMRHVKDFLDGVDGTMVQRMVESGSLAIRTTDASLKVYARFEWGGIEIDTERDTVSTLDGRHIYYGLRRNYGRLVEMIDETARDQFLSYAEWRVRQ